MLDLFPNVSLLKEKQRVETENRRLKAELQKHKTELAYYKILLNREKNKNTLKYIEIARLH
jgi:hypothetical protein